jgi:hypothetical protein
MTEQVFRDCASYHVTVSIRRLQVHGLPNGARLDVLSFEVLTHLVRPDSEARFVEQDARQPAVGATAGCFGEKADAVDCFQGSAIRLIDLSPPFDERVQSSELCPA